MTTSRFTVPRRAFLRSVGVVLAGGLFGLGGPAWARDARGKGDPECGAGHLTPPGVHPGRGTSGMRHRYGQGGGGTGHVPQGPGGQHDTGHEPRHDEGQGGTSHVPGPKGPGGQGGAGHEPGHAEGEGGTAHVPGPKGPGGASGEEGHEHAEGEEQGSPQGQGGTQ